MPGVGADREKFYFQFVTTPTSDTSGTTILLHFDNKRYFFGHIAEGTQRACIQRGVALKRVRNIFLTGRTTWRNTGGLIGVILCLADAHRAAAEEAAAEREAKGKQPVEEPKPRLDVYGAPKLIHSVACARRFVFRNGMPVSITEFENREKEQLQQPTWSDENIQVWALPVQSSSSTSRPLETVPSYAGSESDTGSSRKSRPRKRSHDEFSKRSTMSPKLNLDTEDQEVRKSVVKAMFESDWRLDRLIEMPLNEVKLPAALFVRNASDGKTSPYQLPKVEEPQPPFDFKVLVRTPWPGSLHNNLPPARLDAQPTAMSYIVRGYPQRGAFDAKKAVELGVKPGPLFRKLVEGETLRLRNGRSIAPDMVLGPVKPAHGVAIIDIPSTAFIDGLIGRPEWTFETVMNGLEAICWILGPGVVADERILRFIKARPKISHVISSEDVCPNYLAMESSGASAIRLSRISREHFPVPVHDNQRLPQNSSCQYPEKIRDLFQPAHRGLRIQVEPNFVVQEAEIPPYLDSAKVIEDIPHDVHTVARAVRGDIARDEVDVSSQGGKQSSDQRLKDPEIITLGTGSALPSKYRNVSGTLLRMPGYGNYLFDCGENTLGQLARVFEPSELEDVLRNLKFIWISHLHADHHLGTMSVLLARNAIFERDGSDENARRIYLASDVDMMDFVNDYKTVEACPSLVKLICHHDLPVRVGKKAFSFTDSGLHMKQFQTCWVSHCHGAQAITVEFEDGFKFSYSGDCRPSAAFARMGRGSDVLVHEATFDDGMEGDALAKKHSTTGEALGVAVSMGPKNVVLTHFSQRYQKIPNLGNIKLPKAPSAEEEIEFESDLPALTDDFLGVAAEKVPSVDVERPPLAISFNGNRNLVHTKSLDGMYVCVAFDYMRVRVSDIKNLQRLTPALLALFESDHPSIDAGMTGAQKAEMVNRKSGAKQGWIDANNEAHSIAGAKTNLKKREEKKEARIAKNRNLDQWIRDKEAGNRKNDRLPGEANGNVPMKEASAY